MIEEIAVAGDDRIGVADSGEGDEEVIFGVAHHLSRRGRIGEDDGEQLEGVEQFVGLVGADAPGK